MPCVARSALRVGESGDSGDDDDGDGDGDDDGDDDGDGDDGEGKAFDLARAWKRQ
jgi:hypothetical protein